MDTVITDWLAHSPQCAADVGEDLACVDQWLNQEPIEITSNFEVDEIARSLEDFSGGEFFSESPLPFADNDLARPCLQQPSASSQSTSSCNGQSSSSGAVCADNPSVGMGHMSRGAGFRSFSTNDLQLLLEQHANTLPPIAGLSAPPPQYASHMGIAAAKARAWPALESVPEGAPSTVASLPIPSTGIGVLAPSAAGARAADLGIGASSHGLGVSSGSLSMELLSRSAPESGGSLATPATYSTPAPNGCSGASHAAAAADAAPPAPPAPQELGSSSLLGRTPAIGLRPVPSMGTLSTFLDNTLSLQRDGTDECAQQQSLLQPPLPPVPSLPSLPSLPPPQQQPEGSTAVAVPVPHPPGVALENDLITPMECGSSAAASAVTAGCVFPVGAVPGPGLSQPVALPPPPTAYFSMAPHLYPAMAFAPGTYPLGLTMPLTPPNVFTGPYVGNGDATAAGAGTTFAAATAAATAGPGVCGVEAVADSGPRLRKSQSALELGSWRSSSVELGVDNIEAVITGQKLIGRLTPEERLQRILRYRSKRNMRNFNREIKYQCRKTLADSRPRVGGRFARNDDPNSVLPHQTKKALRMKQNVVAAVTGDASINLAAALMWRKKQLNDAAQLQQPRAAQPASSSTTSSTSGDNQVALCSSSGTAAAAVASCTLPDNRAATAVGGAVGGLQQPHASVFAAACGLPFSYPVAGMPYLAQGLVPTGIPQPLGALPSGVAAAATHLQHGYGVVTAAAHAAVQDVFARLGMVAAPAVQLQALGPADGGALAVAPVAEPHVAASGSFLQPKAEGDVAAGESALASAMSKIPPRIESPSMDAMWRHLEADLGTQVAADDASTAADILAAVPGGASATCMTVDG
ncbi:hypothetical protein Vafri_20440 [Volvox africanus]|uniref:CCT domain-containing protein n=1 Tax=Volvox africanus TaxID=51714 RepID=A0A8J4BSA9_9CHLO|nr:hypothetical protein Vafri_20440 [Volvox africanus]